MLIQSPSSIGNFMNSLSSANKNLSDKATYFIEKINAYEQEVFAAMTQSINTITFNSVDFVDQITSFIENLNKDRDALFSEITTLTENLNKDNGALFSEITTLVENLNKDSGALFSGITTLVENLNKDNGALFSEITTLVENLNKDNGKLFKNLDSFLLEATQFLAYTNKAIHIGATITKNIGGIIPKIGKSISDFFSSFVNDYSGISGYASGGFPSMGQMFIAREAGPELVGTIGSRTAVANNYQIEEGIARAVTRAMNQASLGGNWIIQLVDEGGIKSETIISAAERRNRRDGRTIIPLGV